MSNLELADIIHTTYIQTVENAEINSELRRALLKHERKHLLLQNLTKEITKGKSLFMRETIEQATRDMTHLFIKNVERFADERVMSDNEKRRVVDEQARKDALKDELIRDDANARKNGKAQ